MRALDVEDLYNLGGHLDELTRTTPERTPPVDPKTGRSARQSAGSSATR